MGTLSPIPSTFSSTLSKSSEKFLFCLCRRMRGTTRRNRDKQEISYPLYLEDTSKSKLFTQILMLKYLNKSPITQQFLSLTFVSPNDLTDLNVYFFPFTSSS